jgi:hypothetical protein
VITGTQFELKAFGHQILAAVSTACSLSTRPSGEFLLSDHILISVITIHDVANAELQFDLSL